jgi:hypothetical protein
MSGGCRECTYPEALAPDLALAILNLLHEREPVPAPPKVLDKIRSDEVAVTFKECEDDCEPSAEQIEAMEHKRADRFKGDQLLPVMGIGGGSPSPPS